MDKVHAYAADCARRSALELDHRASLVFFFLLRDTGEIKRGLLTLVPNRLFEPALAILADLYCAVGNYLRGISLSCFLLGVTIMVFALPHRRAPPLGVRHRVVCRPDRRGALSGIRGRLDSRARVCLLRGGIPPPIARDRKGQLGGLGGCGGALSSPTSSKMPYTTHSCWEARYVSIPSW